MPEADIVGIFLDPVVYHVFCHSFTLPFYLKYTIYLGKAKSLSTISCDIFAQLLVVLAEQPSLGGTFRQPGRLGAVAALTLLWVYTQLFSYVVKVHPHMLLLADGTLHS